ncbi:hypothetical protein FHS37_004048 [Streptomyces griseostramineus]|uniref:Uncharacterized protein n=1 Tax=Streptomyces griseomycini TaxID=66895 RepID=A0A7W7PRS7_9ACTN|nr:hypothetical protein [Streptomyces griseomycini]
MQRYGRWARVVQALPRAWPARGRTGVSHGCRFAVGVGARPAGPAAVPPRSGRGSAVPPEAVPAFTGRTSRACAAARMSLAPTKSTKPRPAGSATASPPSPSGSSRRPRAAALHRPGGARTGGDRPAGRHPGRRIPRPADARRRQPARAARRPRPARRFDDPVSAGTGGTVAAIAVSVSDDMTGDVIARLRTMAVHRGSVLTGHVTGSVPQSVTGVVLVGAADVAVGFTPVAPRAGRFPCPAPGRRTPAPAPSPVAPPRLSSVQRRLGRVRRLRRLESRGRARGRGDGRRCRCRSSHARWPRPCRPPRHSA